MHPLHMFQSTRPRGARPLGEMFMIYSNMFQSTRPRGARPDKGENVNSVRLVSIHAPTWGATSATSTPYNVGLFQSTRPRGARLSRSLSFASCSSFNPRAHVGRDDMPLLLMLIMLCFNPRAHVGRDIIYNKNIKRCLLFQSTRPRGARQ